ncbi:SulP family inorganic anion transporter [Chlorogloeopsis fritschii PCC 9212]|uniref:SulP family inorganic anion transporter n=1 Tax=Chlorogloeopsis fritschii TaxID=1124 RepID=UPI00370DCFF0
MLQKSIHAIGRYIPILQWLSNYRLSWLRQDFMAGLTVWAVMVPTALAYTGIAGVPAAVGLYTVPLSLLAYAFFGTSGVLIVGPDSATALLSAHTVMMFATPDSSEYLALTSVLAFLVSLLLIGFGLLRMGWVANFISQPVMQGFVQGLAIVTLMTQLPKLFGVKQVDGNFFERLGALLSELPHTHFTTLVMGLASLLLLFAFSQWFPRLPAAFLTILIAVLAVSLFGLQHSGIALVGNIKAGLPPIGLPKMDWQHLSLLLQGALAIALLDYTESLAAAETAAQRTGGHIDHNQEAIALGMANLGSSVSSGFVVAGSLSQSAVSMVAGGKTQMASIFQAALVLLTLLFLMPLFSNLPLAVLGAIVVKAMLTMLNPIYFKQLWRIDRTECCLALAACMGELAFGILAGIGLGVLLSLIVLIYHTSHPETAVLGKLSNESRTYRDIVLHPEAITVPGLLIYRFDAILFFANASFFAQDLKRRIKNSKQPVQEVLVDAETINSVDITAAQMLVKLHAQLQAQNISLSLAGVKDPVWDMMRWTGVEKAIVREHFFESISEGVNAFLKQQTITEKSSEKA